MYHIYRLAEVDASQLKKVTERPIPSAEESYLEIGAHEYQWWKGDPEKHHKENHEIVECGRIRGLYPNFRGAIGSDHNIGYIYFTCEEKVGTFYEDDEPAPDEEPHLLPIGY